MLHLVVEEQWVLGHDHVSVYDSVPAAGLDLVEHVGVPCHLVFVLREEVRDVGSRLEICNSGMWFVDS